MIKPLKTPNIPLGAVKTVAASADDALLEFFVSNNISVIQTKPSKFLDERVNYHTDMLMMNFAQGEVFADKTQYDNFVNYLTKGYSVRFLENNVKSPYPNDSLLNNLVLGNLFIYCKSTVPKELLTRAKKLGYKLVSVKQGYIKCSVCPINNYAAITDDESIYNALSANGIDCLLVSKGSVKLNGFEYGFIGGCTGLIDKNKLLFNGDVTLHSDWLVIKEFLDKHCVTPVYIKDRELADIGSIIPLYEETL